MVSPRYALGRVAAIILAAGESRRFGAPKLLAPLDGKPLVQQVIDAASASRCDDVVVVLGHGADEVLAAVRLGRGRTVLNPDYAKGQSTSLRVGLGAAGSADAAIVLLGDQPRVTAALVDALIARQRATDAPAVICASGGRRSPPTLIHRALWAEISAQTGDRGARDVLAAREDLAVLEVTADLGSLDDVDLPGDLDRFSR